MRNKKMMIAGLLEKSGLLSLASSFTSNGLLVPNYHRLYTGELNTAYDRGVFAHSAETFQHHIQYLKRNYDIINEAELIELLESNKLDQGRYAHITFDDGYSDCFDLALPVLESEGVSATFFIPYNVIDDVQLGWWDLIAYLVNNTTKGAFTLYDRTYPARSPEEKLQTIRAIQQVVKQSSRESSARTVKDLANACEIAIPEKEVRQKELMSWQQIAELATRGMSIGSHALTHRILSQLPDDEQQYEIAQSKLYLEEKVGKPVLSISYPVGTAEAFNEKTQQFASDAGYKLGYSFIAGHNRNLGHSRFSLLRPELASTPALYKAQCVLHGAFLQ